MSARRRPETRGAFPHFVTITTRWMDNDAYGHVNNVVYYSFFDTAVNRFLIEAGFLDVRQSAVIGLVVETKCEYFSPIAFPDDVHAGIRIAHVGNRSARYEVGLFRNDEKGASAQGYFVHVYVNRSTNQPVTLPDTLRRVLDRLLPDSGP